MEESLYDLYLAYRAKLIDDDFINKVYELMIQKEPCLIPYINDFKISEDDSQNRGTYTPRSKKITIYKNAINNNKYNKEAITGIETIRHEIEHARNVRRLEERRGDIESMVLKPPSMLYAQISDLMSTEGEEKSIDLLSLLCLKQINYDNDPDERIAEIKAWKYLVNLLKNQRSGEDILFARVNLRNSYIRGYNNNGYYLDCPTYTYLINTGNIHDLRYIKQAVDKKDYSLDTRLLCGLPITYREFDQGILDKTLLQRKRKM